MKTILKYPLTNAGQQLVSIPHNAKILCVQPQYESPCIWAEADTEVFEAGVYEQRFIEIFGTGHQYQDAKRQYLGTVLLFSGSLVLHVFERLV